MGTDGANGDSREEDAVAEAGATVVMPSPLPASGVVPDALPDGDHDHDDDLVQAARGGSGDAFDRLYRRYAAEIQGFIAARVTDPELAADLTSQVFTKAFAALPRYQAGSFRGWLYAIARNAITDTWRRQRPTAPLERAELVPAPEEGPEAQAIRAEASARLHAALRDLSADQQRIVRLRLQGLTGPEIADRLGMHPDAVKSAQYRAFGRLRTILHDLGPNPSDISTATATATKRASR